MANEKIVAASENLVRLFREAEKYFKEDTQLPVGQPESKEKFKLRLEAAYLELETVVGLRIVATPEQVKAARKQYGEGSDHEIEIDDITTISIGDTREGDDGFWIAAWLWLETKA